jgi:hypothetical protein
VTNPGDTSASAPGVDALPDAMRDHRLAVLARPSDPHVLAELLSRVLGERPLDALIQARHAPGVLPTPMSAQQASELVQLLHGVGVQASAVRASQLPDLSNAAVVHHARCRPEGLEIVDLHGEPGEVVPWNDIAVAAIGLVPGETVHHYLDAVRSSLALSAPHGSALASVSLKGTDVLELWLLRREPPVAYYVNHQQFNYESLGTAESASASANFALWSHDVVQRAASARRTPSTRAYLERGHRSKYEFASSSELQQHALVQWVIGLQEAGAAPA